MVRIVKEQSYWVLDFPGLTLSDLADYESEMRSMARFYGYEWQEEGYTVSEGIPHADCKEQIPLFLQTYRSIAQSMELIPEESRETEPIRILADYRNRAKKLYFEGVAKYGVTHVPNPFFFGKNEKISLSERLCRVRIDALKRGIPTMEDEVLNLLLREAEGKKRILEIGTAVGISAAALYERTGAKIITVEKNEENFLSAKELFETLDMQIEAHLCDAMEFIKSLDREFDFILLDGPKVQYVKYLPYLKERLSAGGTLFADDVLLFGWVNGKNEAPKKRRALVRHIREYLDAVTNDPSFETKIHEVGEGVAVSKKLW